jgi:hypothetical protein
MAKAGLRAEGKKAMKVNGTCKVNAIVSIDLADRLHAKARELRTTVKELVSLGIELVLEQPDRKLANLPRDPRLKVSA